MMFPTLALMAAFTFSGATQNDTTEGSKGTQVHHDVSHKVPCGIRGHGDDDDFIVGGKDALPGEFPWQIELRNASRHLCGGSIVSKDYVVSAGHCVYKTDKSDLSVVAGILNRIKMGAHAQIRLVAEILTNNYVDKVYKNDISLLKVDRPFELDGKWLAPICLPQTDDEFTGMAVTTGWGLVSFMELSPDILQKVSVPIVPKPECDEDYKGNKTYMHECDICAGYKQGGKDSCYGDSGGPLVCKKNDNRYYLCGITSWGWRCALPGYPGVYTKTSCYADWVRKIIKEAEDV